MKKFKLGVVGAGFMATAIVKGVIGAKTLQKSEILVTDIKKEALTKIGTLGVEVTDSLTSLAKNCEFILFAIKPQNAVEVLQQLTFLEDAKIISIMAGVKKSKIKIFIPKSKVARCMPNTPCSIGAGVVGADLTDFDTGDSGFIFELLSSFSKVVLIDESKMNAVTGISGSSPAYFYYFVKAIIDAGIKNSIDEKSAKLLVVETMEGAAKMIKANPDKTIGELIDAVCSKGGTTIEAINKFEKEGLTQIVDGAVDACIRRAAELENL